MGGVRPNHASPASLPDPVHMAACALCFSVDSRAFCQQGRGMCGRGKEEERMLSGTSTMPEIHA